MSTSIRVWSGVVGTLLTTAAVGWDSFIFSCAHCLRRRPPNGAMPDLLPWPLEFASRMTQPMPVAVVTCGAVVMHLGLFLYVKGVSRSRFWDRTARHLGVASCLAWLLTIPLFVGFALLWW